MEFRNDFAFDLIVGQMAEKELAAVLQGKRIEVKSDKLAHRTGKVFVEYESRGKRSGIATTQADYYCFEIRGTYLLISVPSLKVIARKYIGTAHDVRGGDENTSKGVVVPLTELICPKG